MTTINKPLFSIIFLYDIVAEWLMYTTKIIILNRSLYYRLFKDIVNILNAPTLTHFDKAYVKAVVYWMLAGSGRRWTIKVMVLEKLGLFNCSIINNRFVKITTSHGSFCYNIHDLEIGQTLLTAKTISFISPHFYSTSVNTRYKVFGFISEWVDRVDFDTVDGMLDTNGKRIVRKQIKVGNPPTLSEFNKLRRPQHDGIRNKGPSSRNNQS